MHQPTSSRHKDSGFSLLELMIVMVIIGILVSVFTLSVGSYSDNQADEHARRLAALIDLVSEEATIQGREIGLLFLQRGYEFSVREPGVDDDGNPVWLWVPLEDDRLLQKRDLGEEYTLELLIENKVVDLDSKRNEKETYQPQVFILSSGDLNPPFSVQLQPEFSDSAVVLSVAADGSTEITLDEL